ncbi:MAG: hypothetical protein Q9216_002237 [Gyalolechia sp. 2 TL-2023]
MSDPLHPDLPQLAKKLIADGPHKQEKTPRRVRAIFDKEWLFDTTSASHVWEHPYFPQIYIPTSAIKADQLIKTSPIDKDESVFSAKIKSPNKETDRVLVFEKGALAGMTRVEFGAMGPLLPPFRTESTEITIKFTHEQDNCDGLYTSKFPSNLLNYSDGWFEEDAPIYGHFKDPYKRIEILPSARRVTVKVGDVVIADSTYNMFLFETMLRPRYYMPKTAVQWKYVTPSSTTALCPYKGRSEYYSLNVNGKVIEDAIWWYRLTTHESDPITGMVCFYNEKFDVYLDGVKEEN